MRLERRVGYGLVLGAACSLLIGCAQPPRGYLGRRWADLTDCVKVSAGAGLMTYARVRVTDWAVLGAGIAHRERWGWRGRYGDRGLEKGRGGDVYIGDIGYEAGFPLVANEEGSDGEGNRVSTLGPSITTHRYAKDLEPTRGGKFAEKFWIGFAGTAAFSFEVGVNPVEMIDFIVGLTTIDLMGDDTWAPRPIEAKPAARP